MDKKVVPFTFETKRKGEFEHKVKVFPFTFETKVFTFETKKSVRCLNIRCCKLPISNQIDITNNRHSCAVH